MKFTPCHTRYAIEIAEKPFLDLLDSESHVTENAAFAPGRQTLSEKLDALPGITDPDYNGHFGAAIYVTIDADEDAKAIMAAAEKVITEHLKWCASLTKRSNVVARRNTA